MRALLHDQTAWSAFEYGFYRRFKSKHPVKIACIGGAPRMLVEKWLFHYGEYYPYNIGRVDYRWGDRILCRS